MKIHYVTMQFPARPEAFAINDLKELERRGVEMTVHSMRRPSEQTPELIEERELEGIRMSWTLARTFKLCLPLLLLHPVVSLYMAGCAIRYNLFQPVEMLKGLAVLPRSLEIYTAIHLERPDLVHLFWGHYPSLVALAVRRYLPEIPVTIFLGAYDLMWGFGCTPPAARRAGAVFTHAEENRTVIEGLGVEPEQIRLVYRGVDFSRIDEVTARAEPKRAHTIATAGKLVPQKRFDRAIRTAAALRERWPELELTVIGDGPERRNLKALVRELGVEDAVRFTGGVAQHRVFEEMSRADVFLFLSQKPSERLPNVVKEAIACRAVAVTGPGRGIEELIPGPDYGVVLEGDAAEEAGSWQAAGAPVTSGREGSAEGGQPDDPMVAVAAVAIDRLWREPERAESIRDRAEARLRKQFDLRVSMQHYLDCWRELTGRSENGPDARSGES